MKSIFETKRSAFPLTTNLFNIEELLSGPDFVPTCACDSIETDTHYLMSFDIPGMKKNDIKVEVKDNVLTVSGERRYENQEYQKERLRSEKRYGYFERSLSLPANINAEKVEASYNDGVLKVAIPKSELSKSLHIKINESEPAHWSQLFNKKDKKTKN